MPCIPIAGDRSNGTRSCKHSLNNLSSPQHLKDSHMDMQKDINMSLLEFESVVVSAYTKAEGAQGEAADVAPAAGMPEPQAVA